MAQSWVLMGTEAVPLGSFWDQGQWSWLLLIIVKGGLPCGTVDSSAGDIGSIPGSGRIELLSHNY